MTQTIELAASELVQKVQRGEVPPWARVQVTFDTIEAPESAAISARLAALQQFISEASVSGIVVEDSREAIYADEIDRR